MPINLPSLEVRFDHFRRLTLWTCTVSLRNLQDILIAASNLRYFILEGWTSLIRGDDDDLMEATICSSLRHIHVNCTDIQYVDTDWLNPRDERNAQLAMLRFLERAHVTTPTRLDDIVLKLSIKDMDAAAKLINYSSDTLKYLTLEYVGELLQTFKTLTQRIMKHLLDSPVLMSFINLDGTKRLRGVHIRCAVDQLYKIVYSLRTISSSWLEEIHLHAKVFTNEDKFHALFSFDMDVYQGLFPTLLIFGVDVDPWSSQDNRVFHHSHIFRKNVMISAAYLREAKKLKYFWAPGIRNSSVAKLDENRDLSDVFLLETGESTSNVYDHSCS